MLFKGAKVQRKLQKIGIGGKTVYEIDPRMTRKFGRFLIPLPQRSLLEPFFWWHQMANFTELYMFINQFALQHIADNPDLVAEWSSLHWPFYICFVSFSYNGVFHSPFEPF